MSTPIPFILNCSLILLNYNCSFPFSFPIWGIIASTCDSTRQ
jgi:hypothetical protein